MHLFLIKTCFFVQLLIATVLLKFFPHKTNNNDSFIVDNVSKVFALFALFAVSLLTNNQNVNSNMVKLKKCP